jgi:signal transduction histidine kinase
MRASATRQRLASGEARPWLLLLVAVRIGATAVAATLLLLPPTRPGLVVLSAYGVGTAAWLLFRPRICTSRIAWVVDSLVLLGLVALTADWRSPFYLLWLTSLALPATQLPLRHALWLSLAAPLAYLLIAFVGGPYPGSLEVRTQETLAIHLVLPALMVFGLAYAADALRRAVIERDRRERMAIEAERQRIAWDLHDSAKQRLHAAHLLVSALAGRVDPELAVVVQRAQIELESAAADMDTSLAELRSPLEGRPLHQALADRARELSSSDGPMIEVHGSAQALPPLAGAHIYRIACEAMTNALRHARATRIDVLVETTPTGVRLNVVDDGIGIPQQSRPHATGILAMHSRAASIGAELTVQRGDSGGTNVVVDLNVIGATA